MVESVKMKHLITIEKDDISNHLRKFHIKCMGPDGIYLRVLMKLSKSQLTSKVHGNQRRFLLVNLMPVFKKGKKEDLGNCRLVRFNSVPGKTVK